MKIRILFKRYHLW